MGGGSNVRCNDLLGVICTSEGNKWIAFWIIRILPVS
jgi:hypothetical protein